MKKMSLYQASIIVLSFVVIIMTLLQLTLSLTPQIDALFNTLDVLIWLFFFVDYLVRLGVSKDKKQFFLSHKIDLIVIIPFFSIYRLFRLARVAELLPLLRFTKVVKVTVMLTTAFKQISQFFKTNNLHYVSLATLVIVLLGAGGISLVEGFSFKDSLWWSIVTLTTVGYGDIVPKTGIGRLIASIVMLTGIGFLGALTGTISTYFLNKSHDVYRPKIVDEMIEKLNHFDELSFEEFQQIISVLTLIKKGQEEIQEERVKVIEKKEEE